MMLKSAVMDGESMVVVAVVEPDLLPTPSSKLVTNAAIARPWVS